MHFVVVHCVLCFTMIVTFTPNLLQYIHYLNIRFTENDSTLSTKPEFKFPTANNKDTDKLILINDTGRSWKNSEAYCRQYHTDLACPRDSTENTALLLKIPKGTIWIGLYRDSWKWSDKANVSTILWKQGEPDNFGGHDNCAFVLGDVFADESCSVQRAFICHSYPSTKKNLTKVKVQAIQDLNDPVVKAAILEKMQQKLKVQGIEKGTTLTWREQPQGMVFYKKEGIDNIENNSKEACDL